MKTVNICRREVRETQCKNDQTVASHSCAVLGAGQKALLQSHCTTSFKVTVSLIISLSPALCVCDLSTADLFILNITFQMLMSQVCHQYSSLLVLVFQKHL